MVVKHTVYIDNKAFSMEMSNSGRVRLIEILKGFKVSVKLSEKMRIWVTGVLKKAEKTPLRTGLIERSSEKEFNFVMKLQKNKGGDFISLLVLSSQFSKGCKFICGERLEWVGSS